MYNQKKTYEPAMLEILMFSVEDIIQTSSVATLPPDDPYETEPEETPSPVGTVLPWDTSR